MGSLSIMQPLAIAASSSPHYADTFRRLFTADPREGFVFPVGTTYFDVDFGRNVTIDQVYLGYHNAPANSTVQAEVIPGLGEAMTGLIYNMSAVGIGRGPLLHHFRKLDAPVTLRYMRFVVSTPTVPFAAGVFAAGLGFQAKYGTEYGAGRLVTDTGTAERLFGGGFAINEGVSAGGYQWTFGDLEADEIRNLYILMRAIKTTRTALVVEDPDFSDGLTERIHWGLFAKFDAYERFAPGATRWSLRIDDWA